MKIVKIICFFSFCLFMIAACKNEASTTANGEKTAQNSHDGHNHDGHDHDHDGHNHDGHDHDHDGHDHGQQITPKAKTLTPEEQAERKARQEKREKALKEPATAAQKATAEKLCACLNKISSFSKVVGLTDQEAFNKAVGDNVEDVKAMQQCHNTIVTNDIKNLPTEDQGIFAFKAREHANTTCLKTEDNKLWFLMGKYVTARTPARPTK